MLVIDLRMPGVNGLDAVAEIRRARPDQVILMLTRHARSRVVDCDTRVPHAISNPLAEPTETLMSARRASPWTSAPGLAACP